MKFIANILTVGSFEDKELFNVVSSKDNLLPELPTLVIGWKFTKEQYPNANIINWQIDDNTYWTYGRREKRNRFEESVKQFKKIAMTDLINSINYTYFNILTAEISERQELTEILKNEELNVYFNNDVLYINKPGTKKVIGFSLRDIDYHGKNRQKIYEILRGNNIKKINDIYNSSSIVTKMALKNKTYAIPYLFS